MTPDEKTRRLIIDIERARIQANIWAADANLAFWRTFLIALIAQAVALFVFVYLVG
jgi:hypothetical protein